MKILLVDSDILASNDLIKVLAEWDFSIVRVDSARQAVEMAKKQVFDIVLLDLFLKDAMGYEAISDLKLYNPGVKIITMTQKNNPDLERRVRECGISFFMEKPISKAQLRLIINQVFK